MNVLAEHDNSLLQRKEVVLEKAYDSNPGFEAVGKDVATHFKASEDAIVVKRVGSHFGTRNFVIEAIVYKSADVKEKIEPKKKEKKK